MKYLKYILIATCIAVPIILTVLIYNDKITQNSPVYYSQGVKFYNEGDFQNAYYNFGKINKISQLHSPAVFKQAKSAQKIGDYNTAVIKYSEFLSINPESIFAKSAKYNLAKCYFYLKKYDEAEQLFLDSKNNSGLHNSVEDYYLGLIYAKTDKEKSARHFMNYLNAGSSTDRNYELSAAEELLYLNKPLTNDEQKKIGEIYYKNGKYKEALDCFNKIPVDKCWDFLILANHKVGNKIVAKKLFDTGIKRYSAIIDKENLHKIYNIYTSYMSGRRVKNWQQMLLYVQKNALAGEDYVLYKLAEMLPHEKAVTLYKDIETRYPNSAYAPESLWVVFWDRYLNKDYEEAKKLAFRHLTTYKTVKSTPRMAYWLAKTELKQNKTQEAHNILKRIIAKYPDDYYSLRAEYLLNKKVGFWDTNVNDKLPQNKEDIEFPVTLSDLEIKDLKLINTLFELGDYDIWLSADYENKIVESWFELRKNKKTRSVTLARDSIAIMNEKPLYISAAYKLAYPLHYVEEINLASEKLQIDPYYILSIIKEESHFNETAKSSANAKGLMQLMPDTANYVASKFSPDLSVLADLDNPKINIYIGVNYIKYLKEKFGNDLYVTAAYNAGEGSLTAWLKKFDTSDEDEFIENIPYSETRNYIKKVFRTYHLYKKIYK